MVGIMPLLRRSDANSRSNVRPATGVPDHRAANSEKGENKVLYSKQKHTLTSVPRSMLCDFACYEDVLRAKCWRI